MPAALTEHLEAGHVVGERRGEAGEVTVDGQDAAARAGRQVEGRTAPEDRLRIGSGEGPQAQAEAQVAVQPA